jgi:hypothetical protein
MLDADRGVDDPERHPTRRRRRAGVAHGPQGGRLPRPIPTRSRCGRQLTPALVPDTTWSGSIRQGFDPIPEDFRLPDDEPRLCPPAYGRRSLIRSGRNYRARLGFFDGSSVHPTVSAPGRPRPRTPSVLGKGGVRADEIGG